MECPFASYAHCNVFSNYKWGSVGGATHIHVHAPPQGIMQASPQLQEFHMSYNSPAQHLMEVVRCPPQPQPHMGSNIVYMLIYASSETPSSSAKHAYKCHKCKGIGHNKRFCKIVKPIATRLEGSTSAVVRKNTHIPNLLI